MSGLGDVLTIARKARGLTQAELGELVGLTQVTINRYEAGDREPDEVTIAALAHHLGVTEKLLTHGDRFRGALAVDAHMRRQKTVKASVWRRLEARLNLLRVHSSFLFEEISLRTSQHLPTYDPEFTKPADAARMLRAQWCLPMGPVVNVVRWMEAAGCLVFEDDFGTPRIDGLSQWVGDHPVIIVNLTAPTDRKRLTLAHELGHLTLHSNEPNDNMEAEANEFAAEFLMPEAEIRSDLRKLDIGVLMEMKREWGVSMQALLERAYRLRLVSPSSRTSFYKMLNARGWKSREPGSEKLPKEQPELSTQIGQALKEAGLSDEEIANIAGYSNPAENPFRPNHRRLHAVLNSEGSRHYDD
jgi:Zn-dependent peptidase ImmA (M78 family)/transcriptional regulator with XRE-family HTH domain